MNVSAAAKDAIFSLWDSYLLSQLATDIMLSEVADGLYIERMDPSFVDQMKNIYPTSAHEAAAVDIGFTDDIEETLEALHSGDPSASPFNSLLDHMTDDEIGTALFDAMIAHTRRCPAKEVTSSPYLSAIPMQEAESGAVRLGSYTYMPGEFFQTYRDRFERSAPFHYGTIGYFDEAVTVPVIYEDGRVWMSIVESEITSMKRPLAKARGHVITYGLGLGYYPFMASEKEEVTSVTIIERSPDVISIFERALLPHFPYKEKIRILQEDAFRYVNDQKDGAYDYAFADFWGGLYDGLSLYMNFVPLCNRFKQTSFDFWIESCFLDSFFRPAALQALMTCAGHPAAAIADGRAIKKLLDAFAAHLLTDSIHLSSKDEVISFLSDISLLPRMRAFALDRDRK
ncbi:MAG: hypothetical protein SPI25_04760 [Dialister sp.]|nr:hypothetical protein [Dialister sp.]